MGLTTGSVHVHKSGFVMQTRELNNAILPKELVPSTSPTSLKTLKETTALKKPMMMAVVMMLTKSMPLSVLLQLRLCLELDRKRQQQR